MFRWTQNLDQKLPNHIGLASNWVNGNYLGHGLRIFWQKLTFPEANSESRPKSPEPELLDSESAPKSPDPHGIAIKTFDYEWFMTYNSASF